VKEKSPIEISSPVFLEQKSGNSQQDDITIRDLRKLLGNVPKRELSSVFSSRFQKKIKSSQSRSFKSLMPQFGKFLTISQIVNLCVKKEGDECFQSETKNTKAYQMYLF